jgi:hypothetical protein
VLTQTIVRTVPGQQSAPMSAQQKATIRAAAGRHPVNAFRAHHFAGLGCCAR